MKVKRKNLSHLSRMIVLIIKQTFVFSGEFSRVISVECKKFPDDLEQLVPEIFPQLSVDPFTGKNFVYKKTK
ncbi:MAG: hypothetical protein NC913_02990 [Candidatus Omnitrophica bacterium]|nr:hypothetical protein [Candidatus Omnitrophota bacterium]